MGRTFHGLLLAAMLVACSADEIFVDRASLLSDPAAKLKFPGAFELGHVGRERVTTFEGPQPAFDGYILGTDEEAEAVRAYYADQLERMGWVSESTRRRATDELAAWRWCQSDMTYRLGIKDQEKAFRPEFYQGQTFATVFDTRIQSRDRRDPCP